MKRNEKEIELITTVGEKRGVMPRSYYEQISSFIIETLEAQESIPFIALLEQAEQNFNTQIRGNLSWYLLYVKQDLEARKIIGVVRDSHRSQWIRLKRRYKERLRMVELQVAVTEYTTISRRA